MTDFAAKPMSFDNWIVARVTDKFVPIDYSADYVSVLTAVTWNLLMKGGLALLARFKVLSTVENDASDSEHKVPSWVIDWRLTATCLRRQDVPINTTLELPDISGT
jgi:hypothetical protein